MSENNDPIGVVAVGRAICAAVEWRKTAPENRRHSGVVLVFDGVVYGWKSTLRDPSHWQPGALAIDVTGLVYIASGGDQRAGAREWRVYGLGAGRDE